jgi:hypothetical protein
MEKVNDCPLSRFQNREHLMFHIEIKEVLTSTGIAKLGIETEFGSYNSLIDNESEASGYFRGSSITTPLDNAKTKRDQTINGIESYLDSSQNHYDPLVKEAAIRIYTFWKSQKDIYATVSKTKNGAINTVIAELKGTYGADLKVAQMEGWLTALETNHKACLDLDNNRYDDENNKTSLRMKPIRIKVDNAFEAIKTKMNALIVVNGADNYSAAVSQMNIRIKTYTDNLSIRNASRKKKDTDTEPEATK